MDFETITKEEFSTKTRNAGTSVWKADFKAELKTALEERKTAPAEQQIFRIPMSYFVGGYMGHGKNIKLPAHNLVLNLLGISYNKDKQNREVVQKSGDSIEVDLTKLQ